MAPRKGTPGRPTSGSQRRAARKRGPEVVMRGEVGEAQFALKALMMGFMVAKPYGNVHPFDCIVSGGSGLWRVQVKATTATMNGLYHVCTRHWVNHVAVAYHESELDFLAAYVMPEDAWFIVPAWQVAGHRSLLFRPKGFNGRDPYMLYREAWHLFREPDGLVIG